MKNKIFIVTKGCDSDYEIVQVFEQAKDAVAFILCNDSVASINDSILSGYRVEVHDLNKAIQNNSNKLYEVKMNEGLELVSLREIKDHGDCDITPLSVKDIMSTRIGKYDKRDLTLKVFSKDEYSAINEAIKITLDVKKSWMCKRKDKK